MRSSRELLNDGVVLVTPARRMAGLIADHYHAARVAAGHTTWNAPPVLPFGAWLSEVFERLALSGRGQRAGEILLSTEQERVVWEQVVRECGDTDPAQADALAALAMSAWATALLWELPFAEIARAGGRQEVRAFLRWVRQFERRCADLEAIDQHRFALRLATSECSLGVELPIFQFFGYPRLPTLLARLQQRFDVAGQHAAEPNAVAFVCRAFTNTEIELNAAMMWAAEHKQRCPQASVMVALAGVGRVDANLEQRLQRAFIATSGTDFDGPGAAQLGTPMMVPLADIALVQSALLILDRRLVRPWDEISRLLLSPYLGAADVERGPRAMLDYELRLRGDVEVSMSAVIDAARHGRVHCPGIVERLGTLMTTFDSIPDRAPMQEWMRFAEGLLHGAGWPGDRVLTEFEHTALTEWQRVMDSAVQLDAVAPACSWPLAQRRWRAMLRRRQIASPAVINAVQVVTLDEALLLDADALWVAGLHDGAWPEQIEVNPLLPFALQREHGIPGADPQRELQHAQSVLSRLFERHPDAIWSFAAVEGETPRRPLVGAKCIPAIREPAHSWPRSTTDVGFELVDDTHAPNLRIDTASSGGVALFTDQAACPFRAVARHRLGAKTPADATPGLNGLQRGSLIHAVMAALWGRIGTSSRLVAMGKTELRGILQACVTKVVDEFRIRYRLVDAYWHLERERLSDLAEEWLRVDQARGEFEVIACEQAQVAQIGAYTINTRIDRIDRLPSGGILIVDYKTGEVPRSGWTVPRPDQPQLPIYVVSAAGERVAGIAYARIKKGACRIVDEPAGIMRDGEVATKQTSSAWTVQTNEWRGALNELAEEIESGLAVVDPKRGAVTCRRCDLQCLCRIHESPWAMALDDDN
ncbi:MAG: hypothetical protein E2O35_03250 [Proteobacteria bacterium]|nr:MAG: hypothetical protein E2O35_03250 [Pseudomonadota bacterium]